MPQRDDELPEGTDHIINGAMETGGSQSGGGSGGQSGRSGSGFIGAAAGGDGTGGTAARGGGAGMNDNGPDSGGVVEQLRGQATALRDQAGDRVREFADSGKTRASDALDGLARAVGDTAETIDDKLGEDYGDYARRAADAVSEFADTLRRKDVDELYDNVSDAVRKSPGVALAIAAILGFTLARLIRSGMPEERESEARSNRAASGGPQSGG
ncbi:MAG TPA: hypothetical protein VGF77_02315 [Allosphingosinicella sp.]